jgi:hypothetical protein
MTAPASPPPEPRSLTLTRKSILLLLIALVVTLGLVVLLHHVWIYTFPLLMSAFFSDAFLGLAAGLAVRQVLPRQPLYMRIIALVVFVFARWRSVGTEWIGLVWDSWPSPLGSPFSASTPGESLARRRNLPIHPPGRGRLAPASGRRRNPPPPPLPQELHLRRLKPRTRRRNRSVCQSRVHTSDPNGNTQPLASRSCIYPPRKNTAVLIALN